MPLEEYNAKRDFRRTPEPGGNGGVEAGRRFVVQKHDASRLHYDFRLEIGGVLVSWAVPKGPSTDPSDRRLAVHVEDHPIAYGGFEGVIPKGQYGGGTVMLWDRGAWEPDGDAAQGLKKGKLSFTLHGERLRGGWTLTRIRGKDDDGDNWLLIKRKDDAANDNEANPGKGDRSIDTGRTMAEIASGDEVAAKNGTKPKKNAKGREAAMPKSISPQLCTLVEHAPSGDGWIHEIKFDGYRIVAYRAGGRVRLETRSGNDWTDRFPPLAKAMGDLPGEDLIIDGELTITDASGHTSFQKLQNAIKARKFGGLVFYAFDLLHADGRDLRREPLTDRKAALRAIVGGGDDGVIRYSDHTEGQGEAVEENACRLGLEGIIAKRADAAYEEGRSKSWQKIKCSRRQEFVIVGWTEPSGSRKHLGALLLAAHDGDGKLVYCGKTGTGFTAASLRTLKGRLDGLARKTKPTDRGPERDEARGAHWVTPKLVCEVSFTQWTDDGRLRHPSFQGLREDKPANAVPIEQPSDGKVETMSTPTKEPKPASPGRVTVAGVSLSHPDRVLYPDQGVTKADLARYYERVAEHLLPFVAGRPLSTVRCPKGRTGQCFYQKHLRETFPEPIRAITVAEDDGEAEYISIDSVEGLVTLVQFGVLEIHPWGCRPGEPEAPEQLTIDLDPGEGAEFDAVKDAASTVGERLEALGLTPFLKTTGGKGLHVVAPLAAGSGWDEVKAFAADLARAIAAEDPKRYTATSSKAKRRGKVYIDYLRNGRGATAVAPYSTRARANAPVVTPIRWDELVQLTSSDRYTTASLPRRLSSLGEDPWAGFDAARVPLPAGVTRA